MTKWQGNPEHRLGTGEPRLRSDAFFWIGIGCLGASAALQVARKRNASSFIRQWAPPLLVFGLYNRMRMLAAERMAA